MADDAVEYVEPYFEEVSAGALTAHFAVVYRRMKALEDRVAALESPPAPAKSKADAKADAKSAE